MYVHVYVYLHVAFAAKSMQYIVSGIQGDISIYMHISMYMYIYISIHMASVAMADQKIVCGIQSLRVILYVIHTEYIPDHMCLSMSMCNLIFNTY